MATVNFCVDKIGVEGYLSSIVEQQAQALFLVSRLQANVRGLLDAGGFSIISLMKDARKDTHPRIVTLTVLSWLLEYTQRIP